MAKYHFSQRSLNNLKGVHPSMVKLMQAAIEDTPIDFVITEGVRTPQRQKELYKLGKSKCDGAIKKSNHQIKKDGYGHAVDIYPLPIDYNNKQNFKILSEHIKKKAKELGIVVFWGGDWKTFIDMPHYEIKP